MWGPPTWWSLAYVVLGLPFGIVTFTVAVTGLATGLGLVPLFLLGLVVLWVTVQVVHWMGGVERARATLFLDVELPSRPGPARGGGAASRAWHQVRSTATWQEIAYCLLLLPVGSLFFTLVVTMWSLALAGLLLPAYGWALPGGGVVELAALAGRR